MTMTHETSDAKMKNGEELEKIIDRALKKVQGRKENDLCKFLPGPTGGYMHHFTLKKLKTANPQQLFGLLQDFIINTQTPKALDPKPRAPRGSRKKRDLFNFSRGDIERVLEIARQTGAKDLLAKFSPKRSLPSLKRELIRTIKEGVVNEDLWMTFKESVNASQGASSEASV